MAQLKYTDEQRLRRWDLMALIGIMILGGVFSLFQIIASGNPNRNLLLVMALGILVLSGLFYYLNALRLIAKYSEKSIKLSMMPVGTVKRKIKWGDVLESEIIDSPKASKISAWTNQLASLDKVVSANTTSCLHLKLKNNEEVHISCTNPADLKAFVDHIKEVHPGK